MQRDLFGNQYNTDDYHSKFADWEQEGYDLKPSPFDSTTFVLQYLKRFHGIDFIDSNLVKLPPIETIVRERRKYLELKKKGPL